MKHGCLAAWYLLVCAGISYGQITDFSEPLPDQAAPPPPAVAERLQLAVADGNYPVTPGDLYSLTFLQGIEPITLELLVESDFTINLGVLGEVNGRDRSFAQLKPQIEALFTGAYPRSLPSLNIISIGVFQVTLSGAIPQTRRVIAWGLSRLSDVIAGAIGSYTSLRRVTVTSTSGNREVFDVFRAVDQGALEEDPLLKPGDALSFIRQGTVVGVEGEVYEPGVYELIAGEGLVELRQFFQEFTPNADLKRLIVQRQTEQAVEQISLGPIAQAIEFQFEIGDVLLVPARVVPRSVVYIEGAVQVAFNLAPEAQDDSTIPVYNRITRELTIGDTLYSLLLDIQDLISPFADIERGYILRQQIELPIRINMRDVLYRQSEFNDFVLLPFDRIIIPLDIPYVTVSGNVTTAGRFPYNPSENYAYYLNLAGTGAESFVDLRETVRVLDRDGNFVPTDSPIQAGFTIHVPTVEAEAGVVAVVVVSGDVPTPGAYQYEPGRQIIYYLRQAGVGAEAFQRLSGRLEFFDATGVMVDPVTVLPPDYTIFVPSQDESFVVVSGEVADPGSYPYDPSRNFSYYLRLAGVGADTIAAVRNRVAIYDEAGDTVPLGSGILPEYTVHVPPTEEIVEPDPEPEIGLVLVSGAVNGPGLYQVSGERSAFYYIQQAGGVDNQISADGAYIVRSLGGAARETDAIIASGDSIEVLRNGFVYNFNRFFPIITSGLALITTIIAIVNALNP